MLNQPCSSKLASNFLRIEMLGSALLLLVPISTTAVEVFWDSGGDGRSWHDPMNWSGTVVPDATSDVIVDVPGAVTITHTNGNTTVQSLRCEESFVLAGGSLTLTKGLSQLNGPLRMDPGTSLQVIGSNSIVAAPGVTNIDGAALSVSGGAVLSLPSVRTFVESTRFCCGIGWSASGAGSRIVLPALTNLTGGRYTMGITASAGGHMDMPALETISAGPVALFADGSGSSLNLILLSGFITRFGHSSLQTRSGGTLLLNDQAFLLANVAVNLEQGNSVLPSLVVPSAALTLYGRAWHSYRIENRDIRMDNSRWQLYQRVPLTNAFQMVANNVPEDVTFRVHEFVGDPALLELRRVTSNTVGLVLYGASGKAYRLLSTASLDAPILWQPGERVAMTNSFRLFPPQFATDSMRFYSAREE